MWTTENRPRYDRDKLRYPSDLTDEEWSLVEPLIPPAKRSTLRCTRSRAANVSTCRPAIGPPPDCASDRPESYRTDSQTATPSHQRHGRVISMECFGKPPWQQPP
jgi:transposase